MSAKQSEALAEECKEMAAKIIALIDSLINDMRVPRNVRNSLQTAKERLENSVATGDFGAGASGATYALDEASADINLPAHARTAIWNILSELELIKEKFA
jgi:uncharacterized protein (UPF0147 family)